MPGIRFISIKPTIAQKLILAFLGLTMLLLLVTLGLARWSFEQGFLDYTNALEQERLEHLAKRLEDRYPTDDGHWAALTAQGFDVLLFESAPRRPLPGGPGPGLRGPGPPFAGPGDWPPPPGFNRPPPPHRPVDGRQPNDLDRPFPPRDRFGPPPPREPHGPPTALFDVNGRRTAGADIGNQDAGAIRVPVFARGTKVGELRSLPRRRFETPQATAFARQQLHASLVIGLVSLLLAAALSLLLARALLAPLRRMIAGVTRLSNGDYGIRLNENRTDELGQLTEGLDRLADTLEQNRASRRRWLADISHELRTPVTILAGEIEALKDGMRPFDARQLGSLDQEVLRLRHLIEDLYSLSLADVGGLRYRFASIDLDDCLKRAIGSMSQRAAERGITVHCESVTGLWINADATRLDQLLTNLIENALAYTEAPGRIEITASRLAARILITVEDTPPGVDLAECERLFEPLYRQDASRSRRTAGAGLGLAICRHIVEAHRGIITAAPSALGGFCLRIELPALSETRP